MNLKISAVIEVKLTKLLHLQIVQVYKQLFNALSLKLLFLIMLYEYLFQVTFGSHDLFFKEFQL